MNVKQGAKLDIIQEVVIGFLWRDGTSEEPRKERELGRSRSSLFTYLFIYMKKNKQEQSMKEPLSTENVRWRWRSWGWGAGEGKSEWIQVHGAQILVLSLPLAVLK